MKTKGLYLFSRTETVWFLFLSLAVHGLTAILIPVFLSSLPPLMLAVMPGLIIPAILSGVGVSCREYAVPFAVFFRRAANRVTLIRSTSISLGLATGIIALQIAPASAALRIAAVFLIVMGFLMDFLDGYLGRREKNGAAPPAKRLGPWFDAESDAIVLYFAVLSAAAAGIAPVILMTAGLARFSFGLLFRLFPVYLEAPRWYSAYSKTAAAFFQILTGGIWVFALLEPFIVFPGTALWYGLLLPAVVSAILISFLLELYFRILRAVRMFPKGSAAGLLRSYAVYYLIPFRHWEKVRFYRGLLGSGTLVYDVGAHLGDRIRVFTAMNCRVTAFEPQPACRPFLELWYSSLDRVDLKFISLGNSNGQIDLYPSRTNPTLSSVNTEWINDRKNDPLFRDVLWEEPVKVNLLTLDTQISETGIPDFIKIDVEGFELQVLQGLSKPVPMLSFEFLPGNKFAAVSCIRRLMEIGTYRFNFSEGETMRMRFDSWRKDTEIINFIEQYSSRKKSGDVYAKLTPIIGAETCNG